MIAENMLAELDYDNIPNMANIGENYRGWSYDPDNTYSVPYTWGTTGIIYNTTMVDKAPTSWADLWDEQYAGNILMFNNSRDAYAIAAFKSGHDINPQSTEEVDEVVEELKAQKPLVQAYVMDEIFDKMIGGEAAVGVYYSGDAITMIDDNPDLAWVFPEEGSVLSVDCMTIPAASEHQEAAEMFINFMCETDIGKANAEVEKSERVSKEEIEDILDYIESKKKKRMLVEDIQDIIEEKMMEQGHFELAKTYIIYRYTRALVRKANTTDEAILSLIRNANKDVMEENSNKNALAAATQLRWQFWSSSDPALTV